MNDNNFMNPNSTPNPYRATRNLNTEIENPEININSAIGVNIQDADLDTPNNQNNDNINSYFNTNANQNIPNSMNNNQFNNNYYNNNYNENYTNNYQETTNNQYIIQEESPKVKTENTNYKPTMKPKKKKESIQMPSELKVTMLIVLLLLVFVGIIPTIFDFIKNIELGLMR